MTVEPKQEKQNEKETKINKRPNAFMRCVYFLKYLVMGFLNIETYSERLYLSKNPIKDNEESLLMDEYFRDSKLKEYIGTKRTKDWHYIKGFYVKKEFTKEYKNAGGKARCDYNYR